ncbi:MAG: hypothetical protein R3202_11255 [Candidatus Competibacterales bacterium]|nr:hypothetical protein [Candidatus Competibacterales bacterium]
MTGDKPDAKIAGLLASVKLDLAIILLGGLLVLLICPRLTTRDWQQILVMAGYGAAGAGWVIGRTRRILRQVERSGGPT